MKRKVLVVLLTLLVGFGGVAYATIITNGAGIEGYEWLEFSYTKGMSYNEVDLLLNNNQSYEGYQYASRLETEILLETYHSTGSGNLNTYSAGNYNAALDFLSDFGINHEFHATSGNLPTGDVARRSGFMYGTDDEIASFNNQGLYGFVGVYDYVDEQDLGYFADTYGADSNSNEPVTFSKSTKSGYMAHLLVKKPIPAPTPAPTPEPATMLLFGAGLLSLAGVSRSKK